MLQSLPAGPKGALRNTLRLVRDPGGNQLRWRDRFGDPYTVPAINGHVVMTGKPDLVKAILAAEPDTYAPWAPRALEPTLGPGSLLTLEEPAHMRERKLLMPPFHGERMRAYADLMAETALRRLTTAATRPRFSMLELAQAISLEVIARAVFGAQDETRARALADAVLQLTQGASPLVFFMPFLQREFGGVGPWARFKRAFARLDALLQEQVDSARAQEHGEDICSLLVRARYEDGSPMEDRAIRDELRTLLFAGHETTAITIAWVLDLVHRHPAVLSRLRDEIQGLGPEPDPAALARLEYLSAVCKEALRLHPVVTEILRLLVKPLQLGDVEIPAGVGVSAGIVMVHRDPALYPDPDAFRPERFLERRFSPWEYLPFGGGHRRCIGAAFASFEMNIVVGSALARYEFERLDPKTPRPVRRAVTMAPSGGVPLRARPR